MHPDVGRAGPNPSSPLGLPAAQDDTTGTSGEAEDDLSPEEEAHAEEEEEEEEEDEEAEEDLNTDSNEDSMAEGEKNNGESFDASINHTDSSQLEKHDTDP